MRDRCRCDERQSQSTGCLQLWRDGQYGPWTPSLRLMELGETLRTTGVVDRGMGFARTKLLGDATEWSVEVRKSLVERGSWMIELVESFKTTRGVAAVRRRDGFPGWGFDRQREFLVQEPPCVSRLDFRGGTGLAMGPAINRPGQRVEFVGWKKWLKKRCGLLRAVLDCERAAGNGLGQRLNLEVQRCRDEQRACRRRAKGSECLPGGNHGAPPPFGLCDWKMEWGYEGTWPPLRYIVSFWVLGKRPTARLVHGNFDIQCLRSSHCDDESSV